MNVNIRKVKGNKGHINSFKHIHFTTDIDNNTNIMKMQIFREMKFDFKITQRHFYKNGEVLFPFRSLQS